MGSGQKKKTTLFAGDTDSRTGARRMPLEPGMPRRMQTQILEPRRMARRMPFGTIECFQDAAPSGCLYGKLNEFNSMCPCIRQMYPY
jgi:hypothetical protein